ncbi:hypothetical protein MJH12_06045 [bacterium]|nr:hypothetical protein [bacterium]
MKCYRFFWIIYFLVTSLKADGYILVNTKVPLEEFSRKELKRVFLGKQTLWKNDKVILPCYQYNNDATDRVFFKNILRRSHSRFKRYWLKRLFSGNGIQPSEFESADEILEFVASNRGAVCYVKSKEKLEGKKIRIIPIDGKISF